MPFGMRAKETAENIKNNQEVKGEFKPSDVRFPESQVITESEITTRNKEKSPDSDTGVANAPETVNTIAPGDAPKVEPIATIAANEINEADRLKEAQLEIATAALSQLDFMIGNQLMNNKSTQPSEADGIISSIGHYINEIPDNDKISMEVRAQLDDRYEKIKNGLGELIFTQADNFVKLSQDQKKLLDEMRIRLIDKKF